MEGKGREGERCRDLKLSDISEYVIKNGYNGCRQREVSKVSRECSLSSGGCTL